MTPAPGSEIKSIDGLPGIPDSCCRNLWAAVLKQAIADLGDRSPLLRYSARNWIESDETNLVNSFVNCCHLSGLDPAKVKRELLTKNSNAWRKVRSINYGTNKPGGKRAWA